MAAERKLLMDVRNAGAARGERAGGAIERAGEMHAAGFGRERAGENVHEGALARAVLADDGVDFAAPHFQINAGERDGGAEALVEAGELEERRHASGSRFASRAQRGSHTLPEMIAQGRDP